MSTTRIIFVYCMYSHLIQVAASELEKSATIECLHENSMVASLETIKRLAPEMILTHRTNPLSVSEFGPSRLSEFNMTYNIRFLRLIQKMKQDNPGYNPKVIVITTTDEYGRPLDFWNEESVSNYIMPPKDHWDVVLAVRQLLHRSVT